MDEIISAGRSWIEIDLGAILRNLDVYSAALPEHMRVMAVVKADAYGHGDRVVAKKLFDHGVRHFAVSNIDEAIHIRNAGVGGQILILGYTPLNRAEDLARYDITQALLSEEYAERLSETGFRGKCQFALDTGMRRIGLNADDPAACERVIRAYAGKLNLDGLFTHLCVADTPEEQAFTEKQIALFEEIANRVSDLKLPYCHCMNSAGGLWHHSDVSCFARLGIILYGLKPDYVNTLPAGIEPALSWKTVVSMVKAVKPGDTVGYGRSFAVRRPMTVATVPTGYADGYSRLLSGRGWALINGRKAPIVGRVCMDQMMLDVTDIPDVHMGSEVVLIGKSGEETITADDLAHVYGTIGYEVVCGISKRVDRMYFETK
ncbi:MAG: alanine racemase [Clostridia bacterium]|nr:alanine racemase [Clostridia bacterium]